MHHNAEKFCGASIEWVKDEDGFMSIVDPEGTNKRLIGMRERKTTYNPRKVTLACAARPAEKNIPKSITGHMTGYQKELFPEAATVLLVPSNPAFNTREIIEFVQEAKIISIFGGNHLGPEFMGPAAPTFEAERHGMYDDERDRIEFVMLQEAITQEKPLIGVCRGLQAGLAALIADIKGINAPERMGELKGIFEAANPHHRPQPQQERTTHPLINVLPDDMKHYCPWLDGYEPYSYHSLKIPYKFLTTPQDGLIYEDELKKYGWLIAAMDGTEGIKNDDRAVEMMIHVNNNHPDGYLTQFHPEKHAVPNGKEQEQWYAQHQWSQEIINRVINGTSETD